MSTYVSRKGTCQLGWRIPKEVVEEVRVAAKADGIRPAQFLERAIRQHFGRGPKIYSAAELESLIHYPEHLQTREERLESRSRIA